MNINSIAMNTVANHVLEALSGNQKPAWPEDKFEAMQAKMDVLIDLLENHFGAGALEDPQGEAAQFCQCHMENMIGEEFVNLVMDQIAGMDNIPESVQNEIGAALEGASTANGLDTTAEQDEILDLIQSMATDAAGEAFQDAIDEAFHGTNHSGNAEGSGGGGSSEGGEEGGNWLVMLSKAMSSLAGQHLEKMINLQENLDGKGGEGSAEDAKKFMEDTAKMQAHTQMFKAMQEVTTTVIKSVGEAINSTVRKQ